VQATIKMFDDGADIVPLHLLLQRCSMTAADGYLVLAAAVDILVDNFSNIQTVSFSRLSLNKC